MSSWLFASGKTANAAAVSFLPFAIGEQPGEASSFKFQASRNSRIANEVVRCVSYIDGIEQPSFGLWLNIRATGRGW